MKDSAGTPAENAEHAPDPAKQPWFTREFPELCALDRGQQREKYGQQLDVAVITAHEEATKAVLRCMLPPPDGWPEQAAWVVDVFNSGAVTVYLGKAGSYTACCMQTAMGAARTQAEVAAVMAELDPNVLVGVGLGWGRPNSQQSLGDVFISQMLVDFSDNARMTRDAIGTSSEKPAAGHILQNRFRVWATARTATTGQYRPPPYKAKFGEMAAGGLQPRDAVFVGQLVSQHDYRNVLGGGMEAWGIYQAISAAGVSSTGGSREWIIVLGICGWGDAWQESWEPQAAAAAAHMVFKVLSAPGALPSRPGRALQSIAGPATADEGESGSNVTKEANRPKSSGTALKYETPEKGRWQVERAPWFQTCFGRTADWQTFWHRLEKTTRSKDFNYLELAAYDDGKLYSPAARKKFQDNSTYPKSASISYEEFIAAAPGVDGLADMLLHVMAMQWSDWTCGSGLSGTYSCIAQAKPGQYIMSWQISTAQVAGAEPVVALQAWTDTGERLPLLRPSDAPLSSIKKQSDSDGYQQLFGKGDAKWTGFLGVGCGEALWDIDSTVLGQRRGKVVGYQWLYNDCVESARFLFQDFRPGLAPKEAQERLYNVVFISHTKQDVAGQHSFELAELIRDKLHASHAVAFLDTESLEAGSPWAAKIENCVRVSKVFVCILSAQYFQRYWPMHELDIALQDVGRTILPVIVGERGPSTSILEDPKDVVASWANLKAAGKASVDVPRWTKNLKDLDSGCQILSKGAGGTSTFHYLSEKLIEQISLKIGTRA